MDGTEDYHETITFTIDLPGSRTEFVTNPPDREERPPDDEF
jgi:hypothetical protein